VIVNDKIRVGATFSGGFSSFPPLSKSPGAGVTDSLGSSFYNNFSHIYTLTNSNASATSSGGYLIGHGYG